jgi:6-pyruvoyltetrahydropterin/6-carboxytetrahydropterin synthase
MPVVTATRVLRFNAAHRIHNPALSDDENQRLFGKCNNPNWPVDERSGYVMDLGALKRIVEAEFVERVDHRNLNLDVDFMHGINPTAENIVVACWRVLTPHVAPAALTRLRLWETENNYVEYEGS